MKQLFPQVCQVCGGFTPTDLALCADCWAILPWMTHSCRRCGHSTSHTVCIDCIRKPPPFRQTICALRYQTPISRLILDLKFHEKLINANLLAAMLQQQLSKKPPDQWPQAIIPVPLHRKRIQTRGFNQALEIAKPLSKTLKIPLDTTTCARHKATKPQTSLNATARAGNVKHAFTLTTKPTADHVVLLDDVLTTGATLKSLAQTLKKSGVKRVDAWVCAMGDC